MIGQLMTNKFIRRERKWPCLSLSNTAAFVWSDWRNLRKTSVMIAGLCAMITTSSFPDTKQECHPLDCDVHPEDGENVLPFLSFVI
jgi:hypothetical protein